MLTVRPDFYDEFRCLASRCRHSCCVGWEIDVDADTLAYYETLEGPLGEELRTKIDPEPTPHFRLGEGERCPFLRADGLCRIIRELGEDGLCDICALHPRFYNELPDRTEMGLGLCCEEAARLLTDGAGHLRLIAEDDGEGEAELTPLLILRARIFDILADDEKTLTERMRFSLSLMNRPLLPFDAAETAAFCLTLERMDEAWTALLERLASAPATALRRGVFGLPAFRRCRIGTGSGCSIAVLLPRCAADLRAGAVQRRRPAPLLRRDRILGRERGEILRVAGSNNLPLKGRDRAGTFSFPESL